MITDAHTATTVARRALERYFPGVACNLSLVKHRENYVFSARAQDTSYAVRVHRHAYHRDAEIIEELELLTALAESRVAVPGVRRTTNGELLCRVTDDEGDEYQVDVTDWVPDAVPMGDIGEAFTGTAEIDPTAFRALGRLIAQLHNATAATVQGRNASTRVTWDADGLVGPKAVWGDPRRILRRAAATTQVVEQAIDLVAAELQVYGTSVARFGLIHADFTPENVLVRNGEMTIIDFDDFGYGYYLFDLITAAFFYLPHPKNDLISRSLVLGYQEVRPLDAEDFAAWQPLMLARGLTYLAWAADRPEDDTSKFIVDHVLPLVVDLAANWVDAAAERHAADV